MSVSLEQHNRLAEMAARHERELLCAGLSDTGCAAVRGAVMSVALYLSANRRKLDRAHGPTATRVFVRHVLELLEVATTRGVAS